MAANNPKNRQEWIFDLLKVDGLNYVQTWAMYGQKWAKGKTTFDKDWNIANSRHFEYQNKANAAKENASIAIEVKAVERGLKTKLERTLNIQNQIDALQKKLNDNITFDVVYSDGQHIDRERQLTVSEIVQLTKAIKELTALIGVNEGDAAPAKQDITTNGKEINSTFAVKIVDAPKLASNENEILE